MNKKGSFIYRILTFAIISGFILGFLMIGSILLSQDGRLELSITKPYHTEYKQCSSELDDLEDSFKEFKEAKIENVCPKQQTDNWDSLLIIAMIYASLGFVVGSVYGGRNKPKKKRGKRK